MRKIGLMLWLTCTIVVANAQYGLTNNQMQTITVTGHASVLESPDKIIIEVLLSDEFCAGPKENIDALTERFNAALVSSGVEKGKSKLLKENRFDLGYTTARKTTEMISRLYQLELTGTKQYEKFCQGMISKGVSIEVIEISNSKVNEIKQRAQREAIVAAKDKANNYVTVAGGKLGRVLRIDENSENHHRAEHTPGSEVAEGVTFPMISNDVVIYEVQVVFELQ